jgi:hypothetical protein
VNWQHFWAFVWLRWRLLLNQLRRGGIANAVVVAILGVGAVLLAVFLFVAFFLVGLFALPDVPPAILMYVWDGLVVAFLCSWVMGLLVELQRAEALSLEKFLHLPVSLRGAFLINYLSSLVNLTTVLFVPPMIALSISLVFARGPALLLGPPLLAGFLLMVTALTYQFQGWLASLMVNKRRRRTIIVFVTAGVILMCQLPNLVNIIQPWKGPEEEASARLREEQAELARSLAEGKITQAQYRERLTELQRQHQERTAEKESQMLRQVEQAAWLANVVLPPGWLPLGTRALAEGHFLPALAGALAMTLIGSVSLWRAYRTTVRLHTGQFSSGKKPAVPVAPAPAKTAAPAGNLMEAHLPWLSEQASAVALGGLRSLLRAPEAKMMLLSPLLLVVVFGSMFFTKSVTMPVTARPLLAFGAMTMVLLSTSQLVGNQFGFDRSGFRVFVLSGAPRRDILLGKNLAFAPLALGLTLFVIVVLQVVCPMRFDHFLATLPQLVCVFLLFCLLANCLSIFAPVPIRSGSLKPASPKLIPVLLHLLFAFLFPFVVLPALLPLGAELLVRELGWLGPFPVCLVLSLLECAVVVLGYRLALEWQGRLLQAREQTILEIVTTRAE